MAGMRSKLFSLIVTLYTVLSLVSLGVGGGIAFAALMWISEAMTFGLDQG